METRTKKVAVIYGAWVLFLICVASYGALFTEHGEYGISSHIWLLLTGFPLSFVSWACPHGTIIGAVVAGIMGLLQWSTIAEFSARRAGNEKGNKT